MKTNIEKNIKEAILVSEKNFIDDKILIEFEKASQEFEKMVEKGIVKKRGNNLLSIMDLPNNSIIFNTTEDKNNNESFFKIH